MVAKNMAFMTNDGFKVTAYSPTAVQEITDVTKKQRLEALKDELFVALTLYDSQKYSPATLNEMTGMTINVDAVGRLTLELYSSRGTTYVPLGKIKDELSANSQRLIERVKALWEILTNNEIIILDPPKSFLDRCTIL